MPHVFSTFLTLLIDGVSYGMMLFLISVGLTITMGVMRVVNLMHSAFAMVGGFITLWLASHVGLNYFAALVLGVAATMLISLVLERTLYQWVYKSNALGQLLMTLGMTFVVTAIVKNIAGPQIQSIVLPSILTGRGVAGRILPITRHSRHQDGVASTAAKDLQLARADRHGLALHSKENAFTFLRKGVFAFRRAVSLASTQRQRPRGWRTRYQRSRRPCSRIPIAR